MCFVSGDELWAVSLSSGGTHLALNTLCCISVHRFVQIPLLFASMIVCEPYTLHNFVRLNMSYTESVGLPVLPVPLKRIHCWPRGSRNPCRIPNTLVDRVACVLVLLMCGVCVQIPKVHICYVFPNIQSQPKFTMIAIQIHLHLSFGQIMQN